MNRRCTGDSCLAAAGARSVSLDLPIATVLMNPRLEWNRIAFGDGRIRVARNIEVDWKKFSQDDYIFSHVTAVASVETASDGYTILPACTSLVNNNGNAWTNDVLLATFRTFVGGENYLEHCGLPDSVIVLANGTTIRWDEVEPGMMVVTDKGNNKRILNVQKRQYDGDVYRLVPWGMGGFNSPQMTENHPVFVFRGGEKIISNAKDVKSSDFLVVPKHKFGRGTALDKEAFLLGWFIAEGHFMRSPHGYGKPTGVVFSLSAKENDIAVKIGETMTELWKDQFRSDCRYRIYNHDYKDKPSYITLALSNQTVAEWFLERCGSLAWKKKMSDVVMDWDKESIRSLLRSYFNGDGCFYFRRDHGRFILSTASRCLVEQVQRLLTGFGIVGYVNVNLPKRYLDYDDVEDIWTDPDSGQKRRLNYNLTVRGDNLEKLCAEFGFELKVKPLSSDYQREDGENIYLKIMKMEKTEYSGTVYNCEVDEDNTYLMGGVAVHNCQVPELSKGKILDASLRPLIFQDDKGRKANVYYCDLLVATCKKHDRLVRDIVSGKLNTLSMGTLCDWVTCSRCGKALGDNQPNCKHIDQELLQPFKTKSGDDSVTAELCGRVLWDKTLKKWVGDSKSNRFIEISWVEHPAFCGAVLNHYVSDLPKSAMNILEFPTDRLQLAVDDIFKLRVADKNGMIVLRVAQAELARRMREDRLWKIASRLV